MNDQNSGFGADESTVLETERFRVVRTEQKLSNGSSRTRHVVRHPGSVVILPLVGDDQVCLIQNFRASVNKTLIELPAGTLELGEPPLDCAIRELEEETGYTSRDVSPLLDFYAAPGILDEYMHMFVARNLVAGEPRREPGEEIQNMLVTWDQVREMIRRKEIVDAKTLVGLMSYLLSQYEGK